jgi:manganese efflux pump family protein
MMSFWEILLIAIGMAMDAFAVSLGVGTTHYAESARPRFRLAFHFGFFQFAMPILGWFLGTRVAGLITGIDHWVAFFLLAFVGVRMVRSGLDPNQTTTTQDPSRGRMLVLLSVATSIDALAIGLSLAMLRVRILEPSVVIGIVTATLSFTGLFLGRKLGKAFGKKAEIAGGVVLIGIGLRVLISHLL